MREDVGYILFLKHTILASDFEYEDPEIKEKKKEIEKCLNDPDSVSLEQWQTLATNKGGLISGKIRNSILLNILIRENCRLNK